MDGEWRVIAEFPKYSVSSTGSVRNDVVLVKEKLIKGIIGGLSYDFKRFFISIFRGYTKQGK